MQEGGNRNVRPWNVLRLAPAVLHTAAPSTSLKAGSCKNRTPGTWHPGVRNGGGRSGTKAEPPAHRLRLRRRVQPQDLTDPQNLPTAYTYDVLNRLATLAFNGQTPAFGFTYDSLSRRTSLTRPNGVNTSYNYDPASNLLSIFH